MENYIGISNNKFKEEIFINKSSFCIKNGIYCKEKNVFYENNKKIVTQGNIIYLIDFLDVDEIRFMKPKQKEILINDIPKIATRLKTTKDILGNEIYLEEFLDPEKVYFLSRTNKFLMGEDIGFGVEFIKINDVYIDLEEVGLVFYNNFIKKSKYKEGDIYINKEKDLELEVIKKDNLEFIKNKRKYE